MHNGCFCNGQLPHQLRTACIIITAIIGRIFYGCRTSVVQIESSLLPTIKSTTTKEKIKSSNHYMVIESFSVFTNPIGERIIIKRIIRLIHFSRNSFKLTEHFIRLFVVSPHHLLFIAMTAGHRGRSRCENLAVGVAKTQVMRTDNKIV